MSELNLRRPRFLRFSQNEQALFARSLSTYLSAGVPILEALETQREEARPGAAYVVSRLIRVVAEGRPLSSALHAFPGPIRAFTISMIEVGEQSGTLAQSLAYLSDALRKQEALRGKLVGALIYPALIVTATLGISLFLVLYAFPKIVPLFKGFGSALPFPTRALIFLSEGLAQAWPLLLGSAVLAGLAVAYSLRKPRIRLLAARVLLQLPVLGPLMQSYHLARLSRTLSTLLTSGLGIVPALELARNASGSPAYAERLAVATGAALEGGRVSESMKSDPHCFPGMCVRMIATGERTGSLARSFDVLAEHYEEEFDSISQRLSALIEPALMIVMGLLVGFIALAIITPVYQITQDIHA